MPGGWEWLIILAVVLLLFGAKRLPEMARSIGQSARVFKGEMKGMKSDDEQKDAKPDEAPPAEAAPPAALPPVKSTTEQHSKASQPSPGNTGQ